MEELEFFEAPPPITPDYERKYDWPHVVADCRRHPGEWTFVKGVHRAYVTRIMQGKMAEFRPVGDWEVTSRTTDGEPVLWVRYVGEATDERPG